MDKHHLLCKDLFKKETNPEVFMGLKLKLKGLNLVGTIVGTFGKSGKIRVRFDDELPEDQTTLLGVELELLYKYTIWKRYNK